jgi:hypothetical protein
MLLPGHGAGDEHRTAAQPSHPRTGETVQSLRSVDWEACKYRPRWTYGGARDLRDKTSVTLECGSYILKIVSL